MIFLDPIQDLKFNENNQTISGKVLRIVSEDMNFIAYNEYGSAKVSLQIISEHPTKPIITVVNQTNSLIYYEYYEFLPVLCLGKNLIYNLTGNLPPNLEFNSKTGIIKGLVLSTPPFDKDFTLTCSNVNGTASDHFNIKIIYSDYPIIITHEDNKQLTAGMDYNNEEISYVTGNDLTYSIDPELPGQLYINQKDGSLNGYFTERFEIINRTVTISGHGKTVSFDFILTYEILIYPKVVQSTIIPSLSFDVGKKVSPLQLFKCAGDNITAEIDKELPKGLYFSVNSFELFGEVKSYKELDTYKITLKCPTSIITDTVNIVLNISAIYCNEENGFPKTPAEVDGRIVYEDCSSTQDGKKSRICYLKNNQAIWGDINRNECKMSDGSIVSIILGSSICGILIIMILIFTIHTHINKCVGKNKNYKQLRV